MCEREREKERKRERERERGGGELIFILQQLQIRQDASFHLAVNINIKIIT